VNIKTLKFLSDLKG